MPALPKMNKRDGINKCAKVVLASAGDPGSTGVAVEV
jgi:hypothetical protein